MVALMNFVKPETRKVLCLVTEPLFLTTKTYLSRVRTNVTQAYAGETRYEYIEYLTRQNFTETEIDDLLAGIPVESEDKTWILEKKLQSSKVGNVFFCKERKPIIETKPEEQKVEYLIEVKQEVVQPKHERVGTTKYRLKKGYERLCKEYGKSAVDKSAAKVDKYILESKLVLREICKKMGVAAHSYLCEVRRGCQLLTKEQRVLFFQAVGVAFDEEVITRRDVISYANKRQVKEVKSIKPEKKVEEVKVIEKVSVVAPAVEAVESEDVVSVAKRIVENRAEYERLVERMKQLLR